MKRGGHRQALSDISDMWPWPRCGL